MKTRILLIECNRVSWISNPRRFRHLQQLACVDRIQVSHHFLCERFFFMCSHHVLLWMTIDAHLFPFVPLQEIEIHHFTSWWINPVSNCGWNVYAVWLRRAGTYWYLLKMPSKLTVVENWQKCSIFERVFSPLLFAFDCWFHLYVGT